MDKSQKPLTGPDGKPLNLAKFLASDPGEAGNAEPSGEGQTMFIKRAAAETIAKNLDSAEQQKDDFGLPLKEMLGVITYCYARGVFNSNDIADLLRKEPEFLKAFGRELPDGNAVRRFRRRHAEEIEDALETLYRAFPPQDSTQAGSQTEVVHRQAVERLHDASWTDNVKGRLQ